MSIVRSILLGAVVVGCSAEAAVPPSSKRGASTTSTPDENPGTGTNVPAPSTPAPGQVLTSGDWQDGKQLTENVTIAAGATIEIAPGARITAGAGVAITVKGTLHIQSGTHAKISGNQWAGIVIASGGTLDVDGLDLDGVATAVWTQGGNAAAKLTNSVISAGVPFQMEPGSTLSVAHAKVTATSPSAIAGTFSASYLDYDKTSSEGLQISDADGSMTIVDSSLHGVGGGDFVVSRAAKLVAVSYTTIVGAHCGFHFDAVDQYTIDHVSDDTNSYGAMLYGSGAGPNTITNSNIRSTGADLDMANTNGPTKVDNTYTSGKDTFDSSVTKVTNIPASPIPNARPR